MASLRNARVLGPLRLVLPSRANLQIADHPEPMTTNGTYGTKCAAVVAGPPSHNSPLPAIEALVLWLPRIAPLRPQHFKEP